MRFDPALSREETVAALTDEARAVWGETEFVRLSASLEITGDALWRVAQERLDLTDESPWRA